MTWHAGDDVLRSYRDGTIGAAGAASVERHLTVCTACRATLAGLADTDRLARTWSAIEGHIDESDCSRLERFLTRIGISESRARLISLTPSLRLPAIVSVVLVLAALLILNIADPVSGSGDLYLFLVVVPLLPLAGVAAAFNSRTDPAGELTRASPTPVFEVLLARAAAVIAITTLLSMAASLPLGHGWQVATWLLPALGLSLATLALATWMPVTWAAVGIGVAWTTLAAAAWWSHRFDPDLSRQFAALQPIGQLVFAALALAAAVVIVARRERREPEENRMTVTIELDGISKTYSSVRALDDVSLSLGSGVTGLLGPNGAGKTTLLRMIATVLAPDHGSLRILGEDPSRRSGRLSIRRRLGYFPQEPGWYQNLSAFDFVDYVAILKEHTDRAARRAEVRRVLELVDLGDVMHKKIKALSGGMRRRVIVAQALLGHPELLVLDEPTVGLDPEQRLRFRELVSRIAEEHTVILSTHQTEDVAALCQRVVVMERGRVSFDGSTVELAEQARGRVWLSDVADPAARLSWRTSTGDHRLIGDPPPGATLVEPTIEDGYLLLRARTNEEVTV